MAKRAEDLQPIPKLTEIPGLEPKERRESMLGYNIDVDQAILDDIHKQQKILANKKQAEENSKTKPNSWLPGGNKTKQIEGEKALEAIETGKAKELPPKVPEIISEDPELLELFESLAPKDLDIGISAHRIQRARLICKSLNNYSKEEKQLLVYPIVYQMHLYGYHRCEIAAILGAKPSTIKHYIFDCRRVYKDELIKEYTAEDRVAESLYLYDFVKKEALRQSATAGEKAVSYLRLAAQVESERNKLLETTGYFEKVRRTNMLEALEDSDENTLNRNSILSDIREVFSATVVEDDELA